MVVLQGLSQDWQQTIGLEATEGLLRLQHAGGGPPEGHLGMAPALDIAGDLSDGSQRVLDDIGAGERAAAGLSSGRLSGTVCHRRLHPKPTRSRSRRPWRMLSYGMVICGGSANIGSYAAMPGSAPTSTC